jgi:predicted transcriptional regulator
MPRHLNPILNIFLKHMNWENRLVLNMGVKKRMAESIGLSVSSIDNALTKLVKGGLLIREDKGNYLFNPYLFGKGNWENIQEIRMNVTYNLQGRTFSSHFKSEENPDEQ